MTSAVLLTFANDLKDPLLRYLPAEGTDIGKALTPLVKRRALVIAPAVYNTTVDDVIKEFREGPFEGKIRVFHFGGHASGEALKFDDQQAHAGGLAGFLGQQDGLVLVFLNGCSTEAQVKQLRDAGVKAVVATTSSIQDAVAAEFARAFYAELVRKPLRKAFDSAVNAMKTAKGDDPKAVLRDFVVAGEVAPAKPVDWPWLLRCDPKYDDWRLPPRRWWLWIVAAVVVAAVIAILLGGGRERKPDAEEQRMWSAALADKSDVGLLAYQRAYLNGFHAEEADRRLRACRTVEEPGMGPEKPAELPIFFGDDLLEPSPSEAEARTRAMERAQKEAVENCKPAPQFPGRETMSATAKGEATCEPRTLEGRTGYTCQFNGKAVCVVRDPVTTKRKICNEDVK